MNEQMSPLLSPASPNLDSSSLDSFYSCCLCSKSGSCYSLITCLSFHLTITKDDVMINNYDSTISLQEKNLFIEERPGIFTGYVWFLFLPQASRPCVLARCCFKPLIEDRPHSTRFPGTAGLSLSSDSIFLGLSSLFLPYFPLFSPTLSLCTLNITLPSLFPAISYISSLLHTSLSS